MFERQTRLKRLLLMSALVYVATAFSMVLYPPFQIACCFGVAALLVGFLLETLRVESVKTVLRRVATIVISLAIALCITGLFLLQHKASADALVHTSYPGQRVEHGGNYEADKVFTGFLDRGLLSENSSITFGLNQSENSNFITLLPLLFLPSLFLIFKQYRNKKQLDWPLLLTNVAALLVVVRLLTPVIDPLFRLVLFDKVPSSRLIAAFAVLSVLQLALYVRAQQRSPKPRLWQILVYLVAVVAALVALMLYVHSAYPEFLRLRWELGAAGIMTTILALILFRKIELAALALFAFSILSTAQVHPLYRGLSPLTDGQIASTIKATHEKDPDGKWITESVYFENLPQAYGAPSLSGIFYYPQKQVWSSVDSGRSSSIYNRYAHVGYTLDTDPSVNVKTHFKLVQDDSFTIISEPCSPFLKRHNVRYILTQTLFTDHCLTKIKTLSYPNLVLYVYRIQ